MFYNRKTLIKSGNALLKPKAEIRAEEIKNRRIGEIESKA